MPTMRSPDRALRVHEVSGPDDLDAAGTAAQGHHLYRDIRTLLGESDLDPGVRARALDIFARLAKAESTVHGVSVEEVSFHEVGAYDSIADIVCAAWLIEHLDATWSCGPLPIGRGRVGTSHGRLPVPAPVTVELLRGMVVDQDSHRGERITPTGAAIVAHLAPSFEPLPGPMRLERSGTGFGTSRLPGTSNVLRLLAFDSADGGWMGGHTGSTSRYASSRSMIRPARTWPSRSTGSGSSTAFWTYRATQ